jgi:hypothetical protein
MADLTYVVYFHPPALEALGEAIKPYLTEGPSGPYVQCTELDTGGALCEMKVQGKSTSEKLVEIEIMVPVAMIRLIVSMPEGERDFGFG